MESVFLYFDDYLQWDWCDLDANVTFLLLDAEGKKILLCFLSMYGGKPEKNMNQNIFLNEWGEIRIKMMESGYIL